MYLQRLPSLKPLFENSHLPGEELQGVWLFPSTTGMFEFQHGQFKLSDDLMTMVCINESQVQMPKKDKRLNEALDALSLAIRQHLRHSSILLQFGLKGVPPLEWIFSIWFRETGLRDNPVEVVLMDAWVPYSESWLTMSPDVNTLKGRRELLEGIIKSTKVNNPANRVSGITIFIGEEADVIIEASDTPAMIDKVGIFTQSVFKEFMESCIQKSF